MLALGMLVVLGTTLGREPARVDGAVALVSLLDEQEYRLDAVRATGSVPPIFVNEVPADLSSLPIPEFEDLFFRIVLPAAAQANHDIVEDRERLLKLSNRVEEAGALAAEEKRWLERVMQRYAVAEPDFELLLSRVDVIPISLALAQAANESAWGRSRFAVEGNALFGQHLPAGSDGPFIEARSADVKMAAFDSVLEATREYIHNLNTTRAYRELRAVRAKHRAAGEAVDGPTLSLTLGNYSERGRHYVNTLQSIIAHHRLTEFDRATIAKNVSELKVEVSR